MLNSLTATEQQVFRRVLKGQSNQLIADDLYVKVATIKAHLTSIYKKLGVRSRAQLISAHKIPSGYYSVTQIESAALKAFDSSSGSDVPSSISKLLSLLELDCI